MGAAPKAACGGCPISATCGEKGGPTPLSMGGGRFGGAAAYCFLVPLVLAVGGAAVGNGEPLLQLAGGMGGLVVGALLTKRFLGG